MRITTWIIGALASAPVVALPPTDIAALERSIAATLGPATGTPGGLLRPLDSRLRLAPCPALVIAPEADARRVTVACPSVGWRFVADRMPPVQPSASVASAPERPAIIIRRGESVAAVLSRDGVHVAMTGVAIDDATEGARVRVRVSRTGNTAAATVLAGTAQADGTIILSSAP